MHQGEDQVLTMGQAAEFLGVGIATVRKWIESETIASWRTAGGHRRVYRSTLASAIQLRTSARLDDPDYLLPSAPAFPLPPNEGARLQALAASGLVGSAAEERFDRITRLAAKVTESPISLVTLLTAVRQWAKSEFGTALREVPRGRSFGAHAIMQQNPLVVEDATTDVRFRDSPIVLNAPHVRFYAGVALRDNNGMPLGTLCVADREPRRLRRAELTALLDLAELAARELRTGACRGGPE